VELFGMMSAAHPYGDRVHQGLGALVMQQYPHLHRLGSPFPNRSLLGTKDRKDAKAQTQRL